MIAYAFLAVLCLPLPAAAGSAPRKGEAFVVANEHIERRFRIEGGALRTIAIGEPGIPVAVSGDEFRIVLGGGKILTSADFDVESALREAPGRLAVDLAAKGLPLRARVTYEASKGPGFIRKRLELRSPSPDLVIESIDIERLAFPFPCTHQGLGEPAFLGPFFAGVEHPAGISEVAGGVLSLRSHPGRPIDALPPARTAVIGMAADGDARAAFLRYIATLRRPGLPDLFINYNTWWTLMPPAEENCLALIRLFREKLFAPHGETFDTFTIDDGWDNKDSLWEIRFDRFPRGFAPVREELKTIRANLGLWVSPSSGYGHAPWGGSAGYEQASNEWYLCFGGPKYRDAIRSVTLDLAQKNHLSFYKFDGFFADCTRTDHGHPVGPAGREASVDGFIAMLDALRAQHPGIFLDPTSGMWLSPWWLAHSDAIWGSLAGDYPDPRVPSPTTRESATTTRDGVFRERCLEHPGFPPADMETLGIIVITPEPWENNAAAVLARGSRLLTLYIDPNFFTKDRDWAFLASCLSWARSRASILSANCTFLGGDPLAREPYGFAHTAGGRGIIGLRNPFEGDARMSFALDRSLGSGPMAIRVIYPYNAVLSGTYAAGSTVDVPLEGYEMKIIEILPAGSVATLPRGARCEIISKETEQGGRIRARFRVWEDPRRESPIVGAESKPELAGDGSTLAGGARIGAAGSGALRLLILVEPRGADPDSLAVGVRLDGKAMEVVRRDGPKSDAAKAPLWAWYEANLPATGGDLAYEIAAAGADPFARARVWGWIVRERTLEAREVEIVYPGNEAPEPALLPIRSDRVRESVRLFGPMKFAPAFNWKALAGERSVALERIPPDEVRQDWGELRSGESVWQKPLSIAGKRFEHGLGTHANAVLRYDIAGSGFDAFACAAGRDDAAMDGSVIFEVRVDGKTAFQSEPMRHGTPAIPVRVSIRGARTLELIASDGGDGIGGDHLDIVEPRLERAPDLGMTEETRKELGAAAWIPEDASYFRSFFRIREQWDALVQSRAWRMFLRLPAVQMALAQVVRHPAYQAFLKQRQTDPLLGDALDVARDAISREIFVYAGAEWIPLVEAVQDLYWDAMLADIRAAAGAGPGPRTSGSATATLIAKALEHEKELRFPPVVVGFRLSDPAAAERVLAEAVKRFGPSFPSGLEEEKIGEGRYHTLRIDGRWIPPEIRKRVTRGLREEGVPAELVARFNAFLDSQTIALSAGLRGDYLLISVGSGTSHLNAFGQGRPLAASEALAPVRRHLKPGILSLLYVDERLTGAAKLPADEIASEIETFLASQPAGTLPDGLAPRLRKDVSALLKDLNEYIPEPAPLVSVSFRNRGIETFTFSAPDPHGLDARERLSIFSLAGGSPLAATASRSQPSLPAYRKIVHWLKVAFGYFEEYLAPQIPDAEDREEYARFEKLFIPALSEIHETTEGFLLPAIDACQGLIVLDDGGELHRVPGSPTRWEAPLRYPRPAIVLEVRDTEKLKQAFARYRETVNRFFQAAEGVLDLPPNLQIPPPISRPHADGTLYTYRLPPLAANAFGPDFEPHAVIAKNLVVLSLSPAQSKAILASTSGPPDGVVPFSGAAGVVYRVDLARLSRILLDDVWIIVQMLAKEGEIPRDRLEFIQAHLIPLRDILGAFRSWSGRVFREGDLQVHHNWLDVQDLAHE